MKMNFIGLVVLGLIALAVPSLAADNAPHNWTGFYAGINGGYGWGETQWDYVGSTGKADHHINGGLIGGTMGANLQFFAYQGGIPAVVGGVESDFDWADLGDDGPCPNPRFRAKSSIDALATVRGRLGLAFDRLFIFGTGGLAVAKTDVETVDTWGTSVPPSGTAKNGEGKWKTGYVVGVGAEYAVWKNLSFKVEYQYYDLGRSTYRVDNDIPVKAGVRGDIIRTGINYTF
ncbi:outer membrane protein [Pelobacter propionicus]|uniref:OmpA domain protein transmembrane region-containing protein n=1 Tax=Pelobacter propionicus (strain DSM 2379 / NBRC 103807 / OttBd1) TaxID=338966 RepID=A1AU05_PELPD|nr:outer membrane beta-barrel protein [Pelobacter propionicus]ABL00826.1 OmpA domain protein transmembrane region-containing protein [Pelobacter propionicus DSM 2379]